ncbi:leucyl aminopeptidase [Corynebacterium glyciniphilum]|uniref:leucyl aminopeptidase n=1 Tax=Corynebacterium glyciniphilum TaxID=1404244 RepID=UPI0011AB2F4C|nr:leucyl aminopeptidase [Corynebacterium glyciniphilum]
MTSTGLPRGTMPPLELLTDASAVADADVDILVIPSFSGDNGIELSLGSAPGSPSGTSSPFDRETQVAIWKSLVDIGARGRAGETHLLPAVPGIAATRLFAVGLGDADTLTDEGLRTAAGTASRALDHLPASVGDGDLTALSLLGTLGIGPATEGHGLGGYTYTGAKPGDAQAGRLRRLVIAPPTAPSAAGSAATDFSRACVVIEAVTCARDLVNAPANLLYPDSYARIISDLGSQAGLTVEVLDERQLAEQGFGALVGVGQGSPRPPRLVRVSYRPDLPEAADTEAPPHVALVGKGVTFDTGGISLKPSPNMGNMISDMGGSAAVVAAVIAASELDLAVSVTATVPLAENMPDGTAVRPGDVLRHYGGLTTEVLNTDAEGRLILGDAIARACEDDPDYLVETATLTGAQVRSLGDRTPAVMGTPGLRDRVSALSRDAGEGAWSMPLPAEIAHDIRSDVADLRNIPSKSWGGMAAAGHYLAAFVPEGLPWVHLDVAGPAYNTAAPHGYTPRRATGVPVRTIIAVLEDIAGDTDVAGTTG